MDMDADIELIDRRRFDRFLVKSRVFALLGPRSSVLGRIIDISQGGLSFSTTESEDVIKNSEELDIFVQGNGFYLYKAPVMVVENGINNETFAGEMPLTRCCIRFGELQTVQMEQLNNFMEHFTFHLN